MAAIESVTPDPARDRTGVSGVDGGQKRHEAGAAIDGAGTALPALGDHSARLFGKPFAKRSCRYGRCVIVNAPAAVRRVPSIISLIYGPT